MNFCSSSSSFKRQGRNKAEVVTFVDVKNGYSRKILYIHILKVLFRCVVG